ncbi:MAG: VOC family protein, partial [Woeseiaceae bacterium]|nr:VOC family protein [Woeseiaceae bacterium]
SRNSTMAKVTGIGDIFSRSVGDSRELAAWYQRHLGISLEDFGGSIFNWQEDKADDNGITVWHVAAKDSDWFGPSTAPFMINYRIDDMAGMIAQLEAAGIEIDQGPESHENGQFAWIMDPDGNKVELWEPKRWDDTNKD